MDLQKVKVERLRSSKAVGDYMETFERKRTQDLKVLFICIQSTIFFISLLNFVWRDREEIVIGYYYN